MDDESLFTSTVRRISYAVLFTQYTYQLGLRGDEGLIKLE